MRRFQLIVMMLAVVVSLRAVDASPERELSQITVSGTGCERGLQHGGQLEVEIARIIDAWKTNTEAVLKRDADAAIREFFDYAQFNPAIEKWSPDLLAEIRGIATGSGQEFEEIFVLNLIDEFWVWIDNPDNHHCTGIGIPAADGRSTRIAQNMDLERFTDGFQVLMRIEGDEHQPEQLILTYPGLIALNGVNSSGVGVCVNTLMQLTASATGLPVAFVIRELLRRTDRDEILRFVKEVDHASGQNYLIGIRDEVFDFEASANAVVRFDPKNPNRSVYHTNHPLVNDDVKPWHALYSPALSEEKRTPGGNSEIRFAAAERRMSEPAEIDAETIAGTLRSKDNEKHPICRANREGGGGFTFASVIMTLSESPTFEVVAGPPDEGEYQTFSFDAATSADIVGISDLDNVVGLSEPRISPDGKTIAVIAARPDYSKNRYENQLVLVEASSGERRPMTWNRPRVRNPRWSPDGMEVAFLASGPEDTPQIHLLPVDGGEARAVTEWPQGVQSFEWSPDGNRFAFVAAAKDEKIEGPEKHNRSFEVGGDWYLADKVSPARHLWVVGREGGDPRRLTEDWTMTYLVGHYSWAADGSALVYIGQPDPYSGSFLKSSIRRIDLQTGHETTIVKGPAPFMDPRVSPTSDLVAFGHHREEEPFFNPASVHTIALAGGAILDATPKIDRSLQSHAWLPDGESLLVSGPDGTRTALWVQPLGGKPTAIETGDVIPEGISVSTTGTIVFTGSEPDRAAELYLLANNGAAPRRLTDFNAEINSKNFGRVEPVRWRSDGFDHDGVLVYPPDFEEGKRYPLVLTIHGGPMSSSTVRFDIRAQIFAANGWLVFSPNYRGSNNLGAAYQRSVINDAGAGPGHDVMAGVETVKTLGIVDEERIAVSGWSYGGFMTTWLTAHYQVWDAAVAGASVTDWFDWYTLSDLNVWSGYGLGGSPWLAGNDEAYREQSPITYAHRIRTPMLILSTTLDPRVSVTQSFKLYSVLRDHEVPVEFVAYPVPGHYPRDPVHRRDIYRRWMDWIADHFEDGL